MALTYPNVLNVGFAMMFTLKQRNAAYCRVRNSASFLQFGRQGGWW